jgi:hypothetical protein
MEENGVTSLKSCRSRNEYLTGRWYLARDRAAKSIEREFVTNLGLCFSLFVAVAMADNAAVTFAAESARPPCRDLKGRTRRFLRCSSHYAGRSCRFSSTWINYDIALPFWSTAGFDNFSDFRRRFGLDRTSHENAAIPADLRLC